MLVRVGSYVCFVKARFAWRDGKEEDVVEVFMSRKAVRRVRLATWLDNSNQIGFLHKRNTGNETRNQTESCSADECGLFHPCYIMSRMRKIVRLSRAKCEASCETIACQVENGWAHVQIFTQVLVHNMASITDAPTKLF